MLYFLVLQNAVERPPSFLGGWAGTYCLNALVVGWVLVVGFGFGGWASMLNFVQQVDTFGLFTKCYQCRPHKIKAWLFPMSRNNLHHVCTSKLCCQFKNGFALFLLFWTSIQCMSYNYDMRSISRSILIMHIENHGDRAFCQREK